MEETANIKQIKSDNPNLKQSEMAEELSISTSTLQRYGREINMPSPYRILQSSNTNTRKEKTSIHTGHDFKMNSNDLKMTPNDLKETLTESVEYNKKNKLKGGNPIDDATQGRDLSEQAFFI